VVDDDEGVHEALGLVLEDDYEVVSAVSCSGALRQLEERRIDVVLLDLLLPGTNGFEIFGHILDRAGRQPKVVFMTGINSSAAAVYAMELGAAD
jgi:two-component system alkaline phosphatase synthesis response regulator PhoP